MSDHPSREVQDSCGLLRKKEKVSKLGSQLIEDMIIKSIIYLNIWEW